MPEPADGMSPCIDDQALAAFVDGRVTSQERERVEAHLASCDDCYALLSEVLHTEDDIDADALPHEAKQSMAAPVRDERAGHVEPFRGRRRVLAAGGLLALAASVLFVVFRQGSPLAPLVSIVGPERLTIARPTGGFQYGALRSQVRSGSSQGRDRLRLLAEEARLREKASGGAPADVHAWGVSQLLLGTTSDSVRTLESAVNATPDVAAHHADLGAAYLTMFLEEGRAKDGESALASLDRALALDSGSTEARFNRALLLGALGRTADAVEAWNQYLVDDADSPWADEARRQRDGLKKQ